MLLTAGLIDLFPHTVTLKVHSNSADEERSVVFLKSEEVKFTVLCRLSKKGKEAAAKTRHI